MEVIALAVVALAVLGTIGGLIAWGIGAERRASASAIEAAEADGRVVAAGVQVDLAKQAMAIALDDGDRQEARADMLEEEIDGLETTDPADVVVGKPGRTRLRQFARLAAARNPSSAVGDGHRPALSVGPAPGDAAAGRSDVPVDGPGDA